MISAADFRHCGAGGVISLCLLLALSFGGCQREPAFTEIVGETMGTRYSVKLVPAVDEAQHLKLQHTIDTRLAEINQQMSTYIDDSDLMRFNNSVSTEWQSVPWSLAALVQQAKQIGALSGDRYDISVGPLVNLWGFGNRGITLQPPDKAEIARVLAFTGQSRLRVRLDPPALRKTVGALAIDLSSIAKGWAVDQLAEVVGASGVQGYLVEIGGELRSYGLNPGGGDWRVAVEKPARDGSRSVQRVIELDDEAMATSGDYRNFFQDGDRYYSHTIDPVSGQPVQHRLASVTVVADTCTEADAWATALMTLGEQRGPALAAKRNIKALFIVRTADGFVELASPEFKSARAEETKT